MQPRAGTPLVNCQSAMTAPFVNIGDLEIILKLQIFFLKFGKHYFVLICSWESYILIKCTIFYLFLKM